jgi:dTMP kinase
LEVVETREPGGSAGAESIRRLVLEEQDWPLEAEALLFAAARADHIEKTIKPAVERGQWVLSDRFVDSSLAYQGAGGLGIERVRELHDFACRGFLPDRTLILVLEEGQQRARTRDGSSSDRIGGRSDDFHHKVDVAFRLIAAEEPERVRLIDASGSESDVTKRLLAAIEDLLP